MHKLDEKIKPLLKLPNFHFEASNVTDIKLASFNCVQRSSSVNGANLLTAIALLFIRAKENMELKMNEINLEDLSFDLIGKPASQIATQIHLLQLTFEIDVGVF